MNNVIASQTYLFETGINPDGNSGIIVWWKDNQNHIRLGLDKIRHTWYLLTCLQGKIVGKILNCLQTLNGSHIILCV